MRDLPSPQQHGHVNWFEKGQEQNWTLNPFQQTQTAGYPAPVGLSARVDDRHAQDTRALHSGITGHIDRAHSQALNPHLQQPQLEKPHLHRRRSNQAQRPKHTSDRIFACTFCPDTFKTKYDWARHEKSIHLDIDVWTCAPKDGIILSPSADEIRCVYCNHPNPTPQHLQEHNHQACIHTSRTFSRKDHLVQHLRVTHRLKTIPDLTSWREDLRAFTCRCGFCGSTLNSWQERVDHLAVHFRKGVTLDEWDGDHGFSQGVAEHVRNASYSTFIENTTRAPI